MWCAGSRPRLWYRAAVSQLHVRAAEGAVAEAALLPGDPNRARLIAERFLASHQLYNDHRQLLGFTGTYRGMRVSVQATGMGCPSLAIVAEEVIRLGARRLVRVGTCGAIAPDVAPGDLVVASAAVANDGTTRQYLQGAPYSPAADFSLTSALASAAERQTAAAGRKAHVGLIQTEDAFYATTPGHVPALAARGVLAIEMEASALFLIGALRSVRTGCMLVTSNNIGDDRLLEPNALQESVLAMVEASLDALVEDALVQDAQAQSSAGVSA